MPSVRTYIHTGLGNLSLNKLIEVQVATPPGHGDVVIIEQRLLDMELWLHATLTGIMMEGSLKTSLHSIQDYDVRLIEVR